MKILGQLEAGYIVTLPPVTVVGKNNIILDAKSQAEKNRKAAMKGLLVIGGPEERIGKMVRIHSDGGLAMDVIVLLEDGTTKKVEAIMWSEGDIIYTLGKDESYN
jgi:hypothetical protein